MNHALLLTASEIKRRIVRLVIIGLEDGDWKVFGGEVLFRQHLPSLLDTLSTNRYFVRSKGKNNTHVLGKVW
jgi:hypothetical protein